jgi:hypothetical protein
MPESARVCSAEANDNLRVPMSWRTHRFTSSRVVGSTTQAAKRAGSVLEATMMVLAPSPGGNA